MPTELAWSALKRAVEEALELPADARDAHLAMRCPDPVHRAEATRLLLACEQAAAGTVLDVPAAQFAAPILAEVQDKDQQLPDAFHAALSGRYAIERELGRGGMARVYLARDLRHKRNVALKVLHSELATFIGADRFRREIETVARLHHPHILPLFDSGETVGQLWYTMPCVEGETLRERLQRDGKLPLELAVRIACEVAEALEFSHQQGVVHRDIKPANILLSRNHALVTDFGIARSVSAGGDERLTVGGITLGTPAYMSPEQVSGDPVDGRSDVYSLGCVLYEMLAGEPPFTGTTRQTVIARRLSEAPPSVRLRNAGIPTIVDQALTRALARNPERRFRSATEFGRALGAALVPEASPSRPEPAGPQPEDPTGSGRPPRRSWRVAAMVAAALLAAAAGTLLVRRNADVLPMPVSLAVVPFDWVGDSASTHPRAVGRSDGLSTVLARLEGVVAPGYVTTWVFRDRSRPLQQVGVELQVGTVLRGSVRVVDQRVRADVLLLDVERGRQVWARSFERPASELPELQRDIIRATLETLRIRLSESDRRVLEPATTDARAYDDFLSGRTIELVGLESTARSLAYPSLLVPTDHIRRAQSLYSHASVLDPGFAGARARLAIMHTVAAATYDTTEARREQARVEAEIALRLSPGLPEAHEALASYWNLEGDHTKSIDELRLAVESFPHSAALHMALGGRLAAAGRVDEAVAEDELAMRLEPGSPIVAYVAAMHYGRLRRRDEAMRAFDRAIALAPHYHLLTMIKGHSYLRWKGIPDTLAAIMEGIPADWDQDGTATFSRYTVLSVQRRYAEGLAMLDRSRSELSRDGLVYLPTSLMRARLQDALGEVQSARASYATARAVLEDSVAAHPTDPNIRISLALALAGLGRTTEAMREARQAMGMAPVAGNTVVATSVMGGAVEVFAQAGEIDAALDLLELLFAMPAGREVTAAFLRVWPGFDPLRSDPRFEELLARFAGDQ